MAISKAARPMIARLLRQAKDYIGRHQIIVDGGKGGEKTFR
jgi:hypothetical protein